MNPKVDKYVSNAKQWQAEMQQLRTIALGCGLTEELKWGKPCYAFENKNIVVIQGFKAYCAFLFFKGYLLSDAAGILVKTGENTRVGRQIRFTDAREITPMAPILKAYIYEAIEVEKAGLKTKPQEKEALKLPEEFQKKLNKSAPLKAAFHALTPGRQRAYVFYLSTPKLGKTREARVEKCVPRILKGRGLND